MAFGIKMKPTNTERPNPPGAEITDRPKKSIFVKFKAGFEAELDEEVMINKHDILYLRVDKEQFNVIPSGEFIKIVRRKSNG